MNTSVSTKEPGTNLGRRRVGMSNPSRCCRLSRTDASSRCGARQEKLPKRYNTSQLTMATPRIHVNHKNMFDWNNKGLSFYEYSRLSTKRSASYIWDGEYSCFSVISLKLEEIHRYRPASPTGTTSRSVPKRAQTTPTSPVWHHSSPPFKATLWIHERDRCLLSFRHP